VTAFYDFSGGMESAAMLWLERERIKDTGAIVRFADTGKQFPEAAASREQIATLAGIDIVTVPRRITFDEFLFERGGMLRRGMSDCSRRMKRANLSRHMRTFPRPYEVNLGFNFDEEQRADDFIALNERDWLHWRFPLIEHHVDRRESNAVCRQAGFTILVEMYEKMGRFDCYFCPNQTDEQAVLVAKHYPRLAQEWTEAETRKGHSFMRLPLAVLVGEHQESPQMSLNLCSCFGGTESVADEIEQEAGAL
jgi:3'-phosphoadenosine 5'-phosphosulfate sulfotransferase (PAPS reductase)/FAD synthetase